jgi:hypothetical protein
MTFLGLGWVPMLDLLVGGARGGCGLWQWGIEVGTYTSATLFPDVVPSMEFTGDGWVGIQQSSRIKKIRFSRLFFKNS